MKEVNNLKILEGKLNLKGNKIRHKEELISTLAMFIFDKSIVKTNKALYSILNEFLDVKYLDYVIASRTLLFAKISREVYDSGDEKFIRMARSMEMLISGKNEGVKKINIKNTRKNSNKSFKLWMDGLNNVK